MTYANQYAHDNALSEEDRYNDMTTSTYAIVHIPDNTPELSPDALGAHVTIRAAHLLSCVKCGQPIAISEARTGALCASCARDRGDLSVDWYPNGMCLTCSEPLPDEGDYCPDCAQEAVPEDVRAMQAAPSELVRDIAALPEAAYFRFWDRLLHEYLADPPAPHDIDALSDAVEAFAQDRDHSIRPLPSLAPTGPAAPPARLAG